MRHPDWTRDELILTLELYTRLEGKIPDVRDPDVGALSSLLAELAMVEGDTEARTGRSRAAVIFKMANLRALDGGARAKGRVGLPNVGSLDRKIWREFGHDPRGLRQAAAVVRRRITAARAEVEPLRANLHVLRLFGDELIGSPPLAVFELVKNAYDADAQQVSVRLELRVDDPSLSVKDDGSGMSLETIRHGWLQIGTPLKRLQEEGRRSKLGRAPLGEKGVGRLAAFKLVRDNLEVKEIVVGEGEARVRYVLVRNPAQVERDREERARTLERIEAAIAALPDGGPSTPRRCARCSPIGRWGAT